MNLKNEALKAKTLLNQGQITYDQAREMLKPHVEEAERRGAIIARQFKKKPPKFSITSLLR